MAQTTEFVMLLGLEQYSRDFFGKVEAEVRKEVPGFKLNLFEDQDTQRRPAELEAAIKRSSCLFMALMTLAEYAEWVVPTVQRLDPPVVFSFEGLPEVMKLTKVGAYSMSDSKGMPKPVQNIARLMVGGREEDTFYGYVKLQKVTSKLINLLPGRSLKDLRNWTNVSTYWTNRSIGNIANMLKLILREYCGYSSVKVEPPVEIPTMGFAHPDVPNFFTKPEDFERWERDRARKQKVKPVGTVAVMSFRAHILSGTQYHYELVRTLEANNLRVLPIFCMGIENHIVVREWLTKMNVDVVVNTMGFPLVGGPAGSIKGGMTTDKARELLTKLDVPYMIAQPLFVQDVNDWQERGVNPIQSTILFSLPEMDGAINPVVLGGMVGSGIKLLPDRLERVVHLTKGIIRLRHTNNRDKKVAIVVYNYPPGSGHTATAALLDVPTSIIRLLHRLRDEGYTVGQFPEEPEAMARCIEGSIRRDSPELPANHPPLPKPLTVQRENLRQWVRPSDQERIEKRWGAFPGDIAPLGNDRVFLGGMQIGNIYIGVQPIIGMPGDPMRLLFDRENAPHHQYILFYRWLSQEFKANAIVHMGMHGTAEWMPGLQLGITGECWPDVLLGEVPSFYVYPINNPAEANIAKRRGYSTIIGHAIPPYGRAGLYKELLALKDLLDEYRERGDRMEGTEEEEQTIQQKIDLLNLDTDLIRTPGEPFQDFVSRAYAYLRELEQTLIIDSLHVLGDAPPIDQQQTLLAETLKIEQDGQPSLADLVLAEIDGEHVGGTTVRGSYTLLTGITRTGDPKAIGLRERVDVAVQNFVHHAIFERHPPERALSESLGQRHHFVFGGDATMQERNTRLGTLTEQGRTMLEALKSNRQELDFLLKGLSGGFVPAGPGGDLIRDGMSVLPTGRNIHALDPWRIPTDAAFTRGVRIAHALLAAHLSEHDNEYPETIAQVLWGLDAIKTKGEAIGTILGLVGARRVKDGQGKISRYELIPLAELGRPRIDVLMTVSGIFRDTFASTMDQLDRLIRESAEADEPEDQNFIRKHVRAMMADGTTTFEQATSRIFTQAQGTYGTYVDDAIDDGAWEQRQELEDLFVRRNAYAFGGAKGGVAQPQVLNSLLATVGRVAQEIDSVEYGLTDMQHYYGYSGALKAAAERRSGHAVKLSYVESFTSETKVQDLEQVLRVEYRTKLLNPKWFEGMLRHGHNGASEIASRFTYMLGWSATTSAVDNWVYDQAAATFVLDDAMRKRLEEANPEAARVAVGRLLEANSRSLWQTDEATLDRLRELYADLEDRLEGIV